MKKESVNEYIGYVYKITNKINGKIYIGETLNTIEKRFKQHCSDAYLKTYENYYFYKEVIAYNYNTGDKIKEFKSIREASEYYNIDSSGIVKVCKKITNYLGSDKDVKITWRYAEDIYEINYTIKVYDECGNLLNKFITFADAARFYNIKCQETIARCCQGKTKCTGRKKGKKLIWRFINDNFKL